MKIQALEYFIAMAETGSLNEAARRLYVSQPSLTKSLAAMEEELNLVLFLRSKAGLTLTEEGAKILPEARQMVDFYHGWQNMNARFPSQGVRIIPHSSLAGFLVPDLIIRFRSKYPELVIRSRTDSEPETLVTHDITKSVISVCIFSDEKLLEYSAQPDTVVQKLSDGFYGCLLRKDDPLAGKSELEYDDVKDYYLILNNILPDSPDGTEALRGGYCSFIDTFLPALTNAITPSHIIQIDSVNSVINHVAEYPKSFAISFAPAHKRYPEFKGGALVNIPFRDPDTRGSLCLVYSRQAYKKYPVVKEIVDDLAADFARFNAGSGE